MNDEPLEHLRAFLAGELTCAGHCAETLAKALGTDAGRARLEEHLAAAKRGELDGPGLARLAQLAPAGDHPRLVAACRGALGAEDPLTRQMALALLRGLDPDHVRPHAEAALRDDDDGVRSAACALLVDLVGADDPQLAGLLRDLHAEARDAGEPYELTAAALEGFDLTSSAFDPGGLEDLADELLAKREEGLPTLAGLVADEDDHGALLREILTPARDVPDFDGPEDVAFA